MRGTFADCWPCAAAEHAVAAPPRRVMNSRRLIRCTFQVHRRVKMPRTGSRDCGGDLRETALHPVRDMVQPSTFATGAIANCLVIAANFGGSHRFDHHIVTTRYSTDRYAVSGFPSPQPHAYRLPTHCPGLAHLTRVASAARATNRSRTVSTLLFLKLTVTPILVAVMSLIARRFGPAMGGIILGLPWMTGPILFFLGAERGTAYLEDTARGVLMAVPAISAYTLAYALVARHRGWLTSLVAGSLAFCITGWLISFLTVSASLIAVLAIASLLATRFAITQPRMPLGPLTLPWWDIPARMAATGALVGCITIAADYLGPTLLGIVSSFPVIMTVLDHLQPSPLGRRRGGDAVAQRHAVTDRIRRVLRGAGAVRSVARAGAVIRGCDLDRSRHQCVNADLQPVGVPRRLISPKLGTGGPAAGVQFSQLPRASPSNSCADAYSLLSRIFPGRFVVQMA